MKVDLIEALLKNCSEEVTSDTIVGTWKTTQRSSLLNAGSTDTRSNTSWKKAEFVVAYIKDKEPQFDLNVALQGWHNITDGYKKQYLILEEEKDKWCIYDSLKNKIADETNCEAFLRQQMLSRLLDKTQQRKSEFRAWLLQQTNLSGGDLFPPEKVCSYISSVDRIPEHWNQMGSPWECSDITAIEKYLEKIYALDGWQAFNTLLDNGAAGCCLEKYKEYLAHKTKRLVLQTSELSLQKQLITYGAPGTGKSHRTKLETAGHTVFRTTFHPDSDYSTFVGAYKPIMSDDAGRIEVYKGAGSSKVLDATHEVKKGISYDFVPQAFMKAYVEAWQKMSSPAGDETTGPLPAPVYLVIEEINRGNCAQIFGDLFQLLDRDGYGVSDYPIDTDADMRRYLAHDGVLGKLCLPNLVKCGVKESLAKDIIAGTKLALPPNLYIRATMNTSDQSLFPIDSAFKRRWEWKYVPIARPTKVPSDWKNRVIVADGKTFSWWAFLKKVNEQILDKTKSEDKQLGYFFVKAPDATGHIKADSFSGKVLFYLYNDVFKDYVLPAELFGDGSKDCKKFEFKMFFDEQGETKESVVAEFLEQLKIPAVDPDEEPKQETSEDAAAE